MNLTGPLFRKFTAYIKNFKKTHETHEKTLKKYFRDSGLS